MKRPVPNGWQLILALLCLLVLGGQPQPVNADTTTDAATTTTTLPTSIAGVKISYADNELTLAPGDGTTLTADFIAQLKNQMLTVDRLVLTAGLNATQANLDDLLALYPTASVSGQDLVTVASAKVTTAAKARVAAATAAATTTTYPDYSGVNYKSTSSFTLNDIGFVSFMFTPDTPILRSDGYGYNKPNFVAFPGATGTYDLLPYSFWGATNKNWSFSKSPLYAFFVVLPRTITATSSTAMQTAATTYAKALSTTTGIQSGSLTNFTVSQQANTADGRQVWLFMPNSGASYDGSRGKDAASLTSPPTLKLPVQVDSQFKDLNGTTVTTAVANPSGTATTDAEKLDATIFAVIPQQKYSNQTWDLTINADGKLGNNADPSGAFDYLASTPAWAQSTVSAMNTQQGQNFVLAAYSQGAGALAWTFVPFDPTVTDTYKTVTTTGTDLNLPITQTYQLTRNAAGQYVGQYVLDANSLATIKAAGYQVRKITVDSQARNQDTLSAAAAEGAGSSLYKTVWETKTATLWQNTDPVPKFTSLTVDYTLPMDTTTQWFTTVSKAPEVRNRAGVITVEKITQGPLTINVVDFRDKPLKDITVTLTDADGNAVTTNKSGDPITLKTDDNGQIQLTDMPYGTYTVTQVDAVDGLIKPAAKSVTVDDPDDNSVTLVNDYETIPTDLPATGGRGELSALVGLSVVLVLSGTALIAWPKRRG